MNREQREDCERIRREADRIRFEAVRYALANGLRVRVVLNEPGEEPHVCVLWPDDARTGIYSSCIEGWAAGVTELMCAIDSDYLRCNMWRYNAITIESADYASAWCQP